jgi:glycosyltransferase involved in cell wall biosynthesis
LADALLDVGCELVIALQSDAQRHEEYTMHMQPLESHVQIRTNLNPEQKSDYFSVAARVTELIDAISAERPDWVYLPYADMVTQAAAVRDFLYGGRQLHAIPIEGQIMRGRYAYPDHSWREHVGSAVRRWMTRRSPWRVTHVLDTWVYDKLQGMAHTTEFRRIPEPVEPLPQLDRDEARRVFGIPTGGRYVAVAGLLDTRKGIDLLLEGFARAKLLADDRLLLVGRVVPEIADLIGRDYSALVSSGRLIVVDRYVTDFEVGCCFLAGDVVVVPHPRQVGSSGTLVRAAAAKRPLIASNYGWIGWVTRQFELGAAINVSDPTVFAEAIESALRESDEWRQHQKAARFCQYHTVKNQKAHWLVSLAQERGVAIGDYADRIDWSWVTEAPG